MKRFNKKPFIFGLLAIFCACFLFIYSSPAKALSSSIRQVKASGSSAVYYLYQTGHRKKAYLSSDIYLDYGNKWSDVKTVSLSELNSWPNVKLIKTVTSPAIFYISGNKKSLIMSWADIQNFSLDKEPIVTVSQLELNTYQEVSNSDIGLILPISKNTEPPAEATTTPVVTPPVVESGSVYVYSDPISGLNGNTILSGSNKNLVGIFRFNSPDKVATVTSVTFDFAGVYDQNILSSASVLDANNSKFSNVDVGMNQGRRQVTVNFRDPLTVSPGVDKTVKLYLDTATGSFNNQTIHVELQTLNIKSNLTPSGSFPLKATEFRIMDGSKVLGQMKSQEVSIASDQSSSTGSRLIGKFIISEESGNEEADVKNLTFVNSGSASINDWEYFRLFNNGQIISRVDAVNTDGAISFDVAYLHVINGSPVTLTVVASLKTARNVNNTADLGLFSASVVGKTYGSYLTTQINNISESFPIN